jgi:predicted short-subunit dehydrogenase-like oxidoreductase (DUF2520 family)
LRDQSTSQLPRLLDTPRRPIDELAADTELLLVAVSDRAIDEVTAFVPPTEAIILHASGARPAPPDGFALHPLKALPPVGEPSDLDDMLLVFQGAHRKTARLIATAVGARFAEVTAEQKPLYHAAAVFGANYVAAVLDISDELMRRAGVNGTRKDVVALAESAIRNWTDHTDAGRFTGPAARGDEDTIRRHLQVLSGDAQVADLYKLLADWIAARRLATPK